MRSGGAVGAESCGGSSAAVTAELTAPPSQEGAVPRGCALLCQSSAELPAPALLRAAANLSRNVYGFLSGRAPQEGCICMGCYPEPFSPWSFVDNTDSKCPHSSS